MNNDKKLEIQHGKMPPHEIELEAVVLGSAILEADALLEIVDKIDGNCFFDSKYRAVWEQGIMPLYKENQKIDLLTVINQLKTVNKLEYVGGALAISELTSRIGMTTNVGKYALIIKQAAIKRDVIRVCSVAISKAYDESIDALELLDSTAKEMDQIGLKVASQSFVKIGDAVGPSLEKTEQLAHQDTELTGVPSGFRDLDKITNGWQPSDLIIIGARPSMGKSAGALNLAENAAINHNVNVAFFSLEMSTSQLVIRSIASQANIEMNKLKRGNLTEEEWEKVNKGIIPLLDTSIYIDDTPGLSVFELKTKIRRLDHDLKQDPKNKEGKGIGFIIIDYLQLMEGDRTSNKMGGNREQEISTISRNLKKLAKEMDIPIIALSQLSRAVESRGGDKKPMLSDLRESGAIEQDADIVIFLYRPEYYGIEGIDGEDLTNKALWIIAKHRNGSLGEVPLGFFGAKSKFTDLNDFSDMDDGLGQLPFKARGDELYLDDS